MRPFLVELKLCKGLADPGVIHYVQTQVLAELVAAGGNLQGHYVYARRRVGQFVGEGARQGNALLRDDFAGGIHQFAVSIAAAIQQSLNAEVFVGATAINLRVAVCVVLQVVNFNQFHQLLHVQHSIM